MYIHMDLYCSYSEDKDDEMKNDILKINNFSELYTHTYF